MSDNLMYNTAVGFASESRGVILEGVSMLRTHSLCFLALFAGSALAQVDTGTISGVITDSTGAIVPGAKVTITQTDTNARVTMDSNGAGFYSAPALHAGPYEV